jgi:hypothetical protein
MKKQIGNRKKIRLVEEVSPSEVISKEKAGQTLWNAPPPTEVRYWVDGYVSKRDLAKAGIPYVYWGPRTLEEFDMFFAPPGIRVFGANAPELLRKLGYEVEVVTKEEIMRLYEESIRAEQERREREWRARWAERERRMERLHRFAEAHGLLRLSGVQEAAEFFDGQPRVIPYKVWHDDDPGRLRIGRSKKTGRLLLLLDYGMHYIAFVDPETFEAICEARWQRLTETEKNDPHAVYFRCLVRAQLCSDCSGAEWAKWVVEKKAGLLEGLKQYVVVARRNSWEEYDAKRVWQICKELGIEMRISQNRSGVFRKDRLPEDL